MRKNWLWVFVTLVVAAGFASVSAKRLSAATMKIQRANLDGTGVEDLVTTGLLFPQGIALDLAGGKMYWPDDQRIQRADLDGNVVVTLVEGLVNPLGIALDVAAGKMYWTDTETNKIQRANFDGTGVEDLVTTGLDTPWGITHIPGSKIYWTDSNNSGSAVAKVTRSDLDGTNVENLVLPPALNPRFIALDTAGDKMYWTDIGTIRQANLDGTSIENNFIDGLPGAMGIALDLAGGKLYWTDSSTGKIQRANLDGSGVADLVSGLGAPRGIALDVAGGKMYWTNTGALVSPSLGLSLNQVNFFPGDTLVASVSVNNPGSPVTLDFYCGALLPDGDTIVFFTDLNFSNATGSLSNVATLTPMAPGIDLSGPFSVNEPSFFTFVWDAFSPPAPYTMFLAAVGPGGFADGTVDDGDIVAISTALFTFSH